MSISGSTIASMPRTASKAANPVASSRGRVTRAGIPWRGRIVIPRLYRLSRPSSLKMSRRTRLARTKEYIGDATDPEADHAVHTGHAADDSVLPRRARIAVTHRRTWL